MVKEGCVQNVNKVLLIKRAGSNSGWGGANIPGGSLFLGGGSCQIFSGVTRVVRRIFSEGGGEEQDA